MEDTERLRVVLSHATPMYEGILAPTQGQVTIFDKDTATIGIEPVGSVVEGSAFAVVVKGDAPVDEDFVVKVTTSDSTASNAATATTDYPAVDETLSFTNRSQEESLTVTLPDDDTQEGEEVFLVEIEMLTTTLAAAARVSLSPVSRTVTIVDSDDAMLSALALTDSDSNSIALDQTFNAARTSYTTTVDNDIEEVTVTPTTNDDGATVEYLDESDQTLTDADLAAGHQVSLDVGANTVKVKVTAEDGNATKTYTVVVTRESERELVVSATRLTVDEGGTGTFKVKLASQPDATVTVSVSSPDTGAVAITGGGSLSFTTANWQTEQTVTLSGVQDSDSRQESISVTLLASGGGYGGREASVLVTVLDDEAPEPGLVLSPTTLTVDEGGSGTFTVKLATQPTAGVTVSVRSSRNSIATVSPGSLTFTTSNWSNERTVTVNGVEDADFLNESANITLRGSGGDYEGETGTVAVSVMDDEQRETTLIDTLRTIVLSQSAISVPEGGFGTFTVRLGAEPSAGVTVDLSSGDTTIATVSPGSLTFTPSDWRTARTVTVNGVEDVDARWEETTVTLEVSASGADYRGVDAEVEVAVRDNDPRIRASFSSSSYEATEGGAAATIVVELSRADSEDATFPLYPYVPNATTRPHDYSGLPESVTIKAGETRASFTVTAVDDKVSEERDNRFEITLDTLPEGFEKGDVVKATVRLIDNDPYAGAPIYSLQSASVSADEGDDLVFRINIERPTDRRVMLFFRTAEGTAVRNTDYKPPHTIESSLDGGSGLTVAEIRISTVEDDTAEPDETFELTLQSSGSYGLKNPRTATGTILDDDNGGDPYVDTIPADTSTTASVSVGGSLKGDLETAKDVDWIKASLTKDRCYKFVLSGRGNEDGLTLWDPLIYGIYRQDATLIPGTRDDDGGDEVSQAQMLLRPSATSTHYISVAQSFRFYNYPDGGSYRLSLTDLGTEVTNCGYSNRKEPLS